MTRPPTPRVPGTPQIAVEIDRLVVGAYTAAVTSANQPTGLDRLGPYPAALLHTLAFVLLARPVSYEDLRRVVPYTPSDVLSLIVSHSVADGILETESPALLTLTTAGRQYAEGVVHLHERTVETLWAAQQNEIDTLLPLASHAVRRARELPAPIVPATFPLFAAVGVRPTPAAQLLRLITALRYWRADAHRRALADAQLTAPEAHALNRLWDEHRGLERVGQNYPDPATDAAANIQARDLAANGKITPAGLALRERVEATTNRLADPPYEELAGDGRQQQLLEGLTALPV